MTSLWFRLLSISSYGLIILKRFPWICAVLTGRFAAFEVLVMGVKDFVWRFFPGIAVDRGLSGPPGPGHLLWVGPSVLTRSWPWPPLSGPGSGQVLASAHFVEVGDAHSNSRICSY